jgi:hypothetical protein
MPLLFENREQLPESNQRFQLRGLEDRFTIDEIKTMNDGGNCGFYADKNFIADLEKLSANSGETGKTKTIATKLHKNDRCILQALVNYKERVYQVDLETTTKLSRKTVGKRLKKLQEADYVSYPEGERGGIEITKAGENALLGTTQ